MDVVLTGATGFIGSHVLADLYKHGHEVTALVRDDAQAEAVAARGATPIVVDAAGSTWAPTRTRCASSAASPTMRATAGLR